MFGKKQLIVDPEWESLTPMSFKKSMQAVRGMTFDDGKAGPDRKEDRKASNPTAKALTSRGGVGVQIRRAPPRRRKAGKRSKAAGNVPRLPPPFDAVFIVPVHTRYLATSGLTGAAVTRQILAGALGGLCTTANSLHTSWASAFRITKLVCWPPAGGDCNIEWNAANSTAEQALEREKMVVNTLPTGVTSTGGMVTRPPPKSYLALWQFLAVDKTDQLFNIICSSGTVIDLHGVMTLSADVNSPGTNTVQNGIATGILAQQYYLALDGPGSNKLQPQGLLTTF